MFDSGGLMFRRRRAAGSLASQLLARWADANGGLAADFTDPTFTGGSARVVDPVTPANMFSGGVNDLFAITTSPKWILNSSGVYVQTAANTLATEYDASGTSLGIRVEEGRTNLCLHSADFTNAVWTKLGSTATADTIVEDSSTGAHRLLQSTTKAASALTYTLQARIKASGRSQVRLIFDDTGSNAVSATYDLSSGTIVVAAAAAGTYTGASATISPDVDGYYRCTLTGTTNASTNLRWQLQLASGGAVSYTGTNGLTGAQFRFVGIELGASATSPIVTTSSSVARAADLPTEPLSALPSLGSAYSIYCKYRPFSAAAENRVIRLDDGTANEVVALGNTSGGAGAVWVVDGGANQTDPLTTGTITNSAFHRLAASIEGNNIRLSVNGGTVVQDTSATLPTPTTLRLCPVGFAHMEELMILPRAASDADLQGFGA